MITPHHDYPSIEPPCRVLEWDTQFFGVKIAAVRANSLTAASAVTIDGWCVHHGINCLYFFADGSDSRSVDLAESCGYHLVDFRHTYDLTLADAPKIVEGPAKVRLAVPADVAELERIAARSHEAARFYFDPHFQRSQADALYARWVRASCEGFADAVFVVERERRPVGYIACDMDLNTRGGKITLMAIDAAARGQGLGSAMVMSALAWFATREIQTVSVVTQGRNVTAQRLYQKCGFRTRSLQLTYHKWFAQAQSPSPA